MNDRATGFFSRADWIMALGATMIAGLAYLTLLTQNLTWDSIAMASPAFHVGDEGLLNPHHLIYNVLLRMILMIADRMDDPIGALNTLQSVNAALSAVAMGLYFLICRRLGASTVSAAAVTAVAAFALGFWRYSSQLEGYNLSTLLVLLALFAYLSDRAGWGWKLLGGFCVLLAMLVHQTAIFFVIGLGVQILFSRHDRRSIVRDLLVYIVGPGVLVAVAYLIATHMVRGDMSPGSVWLFLTEYAQTGRWGRVSAMNFLRAPFGMVNSIISIEPSGIRGLNIPLVVGVMLFGAGALSLLVSIVKEWRTPRERREPRLLLITWILLHSAFVWWWYAQNIEFWIILVPAILLGFLLWSPRLPRLALAGLAAIVMSELVLNLPDILASHRNESPYQRIAEGMMHAADSSDLVIVTTRATLTSYVRFLTRSNPVYLYDYFPYWTPPAGDTSDATDQTITWISSLIDSTRAARGNVYLEIQSLENPPDVPLYLPIDLPRLHQWMASLHWVEQRSNGVMFYRLE